MSETKNNLPTLPAPVDHATTTGMAGAGFYNQNSAPQWKAIEEILPWLDEAASNLPLDGSGPITLADFGCSEGRNSIHVLSLAVDKLRQLTGKPIQTVHSDLPTNDFSEVFSRLRPKGHSAFGGAEIYSSVVGGSMFDQLLPPQSVQLATTFNAIGFLSRKPLKILPGYILPNGPSRVRRNGFVSKLDLQTFSDLAKEDIATFLRARAPELVPGGYLLVQVFGTTNEHRTCDGIYDLLNDAVLHFVEGGDIPKDCYEAYYQPVYMRSLDELTGPLTDPDLGAQGLFELERSQSYEVSVPFNERFEATGDIESFAEAYVNFFRAFTESVLLNALSATPDRQKLVDRIYDKAKEILRQEPGQYPFHYAAVAMLLKRNGQSD